MKHRIYLIVSLLMCVACGVKAQTPMQLEFEKFLSLFPVITWEDLPSIVYDYDLITSREQIPYQVLRRNMWYEEPQNGPKNVYNHIKNEIKSADYSFTTPPPHIIDEDGDYIHFEKLGGYGEVYPIGRIDVSDDILLLVLYNSIGDFFANREFYTVKKSTQQMISAYLAMGNLNTAYFNNDFMFVFFEDHANELTDEEIWTDPRYAHRKVVQLLPNGYFVEKEKQTGLYSYYGFTKDSDGYSNVRNAPSANSEVLYQVKDSTYVDTYGTPDGSWLEVARVVEHNPNEVISTTKFGGYIHKSRLRDFEKWRKSLRNPDYNK